MAGKDAQALAHLAQAEVLRIHNKYSRYQDDSVVSRINATAGRPQWHTLDDETAALIDYADTVWRQSHGLFDITAGVLRKAWDFRAGKVPRQTQLDALLPLIDWPSVQWNRPRIRLPKTGMQLDFGGFGKEYAADRAAAILREQGVRHGLVDLSGDIRVLGPHGDNSPWIVGIQHPRKSGPIASLKLLSGALATSGDYERSFVHQGRRYSHILNPRSGWPVQSLASVSVLADDCLIAGTACTCAMLMGANDGLRWLRELGLPFLAVDQDMQVIRHDSQPNHSG